LTKFGIDSHNVVVNQLVFKSKNNKCEICDARTKIQSKYMGQIFELYSDFHIVQMPLLGKEIRGCESLEAFGKYLLKSYPEEFKNLEEKL
jgi:arsenite/tail-anchored protein-transporting ATPase